MVVNRRFNFHNDSTCRRSAGKSVARTDQHFSSNVEAVRICVK